MWAVAFSETLVLIYKTIRRHIQGSNLHSTAVITSNLTHSIIVTHMTIVRQRLGKNIPEISLSTI
jgi:hypothetical protein